MYESSPASSRALAPSTCLHEDYMIEGILGEGGFAITYIGRHLPTERLVAIKEYFPAKLAIRGEDGSLCSLSGKEEALFLKGRQHFYREANLLKEFQYIESVVSVYEVFEENHTAYIIMEYIQGLTLERYIKEQGPLHFTEMMPLFTPVIHALSIIHEKKQIHRDISPDNLILDSHNCLHLIDFGAAISEDISGRRNTVILKSGYAPPEQYIPDSKIGAWVDVYALCATMYFALTGHPPTDAIHRMDDEDAPSFLVSLTDIHPWQRAALEKGLHLQPAKRFDNINDLYCALTVPPHQREAVTVMGNALGQRDKRKIRRIRIHRKLLPTLFVAVLFLTLAGTAAVIRYAIKSVPAQERDTVSGILSHPSGSPDTAPSSSALPATDTSAAPSGGTSQEGDGTLPATLLSMPNLSGIPLKQAKKVLKNLDSSIRINTVRVYDGKVKKGWVISQSVAEDSVFSEGHLASVLLTVSLGREQQGKTNTTPPGTNEPTQKEQTKTSPPDYKVSPDDEEYVTIPLE